jgi:hypothetical protein
LEDLNVEIRIKLKWILQKLDANRWSGFNCSSEYNNETSGSMEHNVMNR